MASPAEPTMASALPKATAADMGASKTLAKRVKKYLVFQSGAEVTESMFGSEKELAAATGNAYHRRIQNIDFTSDKMTELFGPPPPGFVEEAAMGVLQASSGGSTLYALFKNLKSEFRNRWTPFAEFRSGENEDDMLRRVYQMVWAERKNLENRKKGRAQDALPEQCPANFVPLESQTFVAFREHHTLRKEPSSLLEIDENLTGGLEKRPMSRAEQRGKKKMKTDSNSGVTEEDIQKGLSIAAKQKEILALQTDIQLAMAVKGVDHEYFKELMESIKERRKKMTEEEQNNNDNSSSSSSNNNNNNNNNNNSSDSDN